MSIRTRALSAVLAALALSALPACDEQDTSFRPYSGAADSIPFFAADGEYNMTFETLENTCGTERPSGTRVVNVLGGSMEDGRPSFSMSNAVLPTLGMPGSTDFGANERYYSNFMSRTPDWLEFSSSETAGRMLSTIDEGSATRIVYRQETTMSAPSACRIVHRIVLTRVVAQSGV
jgi:hypothetical protein